MPSLQRDENSTGVSRFLRALISAGREHGVWLLLSIVLMDQE